MTQHFTISSIFCFLVVNLINCHQNDNFTTKTDRLAQMDKQYVLAFEQRLVSMFGRTVPAKLKRFTTENPLENVNLKIGNEMIPPKFRQYTMEIKGHRLWDQTNEENQTFDEYCSIDYTFKFIPHRLSKNNTLHLLAMELSIENQSSIILHIHDSLDGSILTLVDYSNSEETKNGNFTTRFDITPEIYPFWTTNLTLFQLEVTLKHKNTDCIDMSDEKHPILTINVQENAKINGLINNLDENQSITNRQTRNNVVDLVPNCETMWDSSFLKSIKADQYNFIGASCCKRNLMINFKKLGWDNWVVAPKFFAGSYCLGRCTVDPSNKIESQCKPVSFSSLTVTTRVTDDQMMTQTLNDFVVKECACV